MRLNSKQIDTLSRYFADLSKVLFISTVLAFFIPNSFGHVTFVEFFGGSITTLAFLVFSLKLVALSPEQ